MNRVISLGRTVYGWCDIALQPLFLLGIRLYVASVFLASGREKLADWSSTIALFHDEYKVPVLPPDVAAYVGTFGELFFPVLIVLGLFGRPAAVGLFFVNVMAVLSYPQLWGFDCPAAINFHFFWGSILIALIAFGPGTLSIDHILEGRYKPARA
jgi:putative oxidoreductase